MKNLRHVLFPLATLLLACNSPLLNHADATDLVREPIHENDPGCPIEFPKSGLCATWSWEKLPNSQDYGTATLRFWVKNQGTAAGPYVTPGQTVFVKLWMPSMGHGSSPVTTSPKLDSSGDKVPGIFESTGIFFVMPGAWEIWIQLKNGTEIDDQSKFEITL
jgi:hypothetical protein